MRVISFIIWFSLLLGGSFQLAHAGDVSGVPFFPEDVRAKPSIDKKEKPHIQQKRSTRKRGKAQGAKRGGALDRRSEEIVAAEPFLKKQHSALIKNLVKVIEKVKVVQGVVSKVKGGFDSYVTDIVGNATTRANDQFNVGGIVVGGTVGFAISVSKFAIPPVVGTIATQVIEYRYNPNGFDKVDLAVAVIEIGLTIGYSAYLGPVVGSLAANFTMKAATMTIIVGVAVTEETSKRIKSVRKRLKDAGK